MKRLWMWVCSNEEWMPSNTWQSTRLWMWVCSKKEWMHEDFQIRIRKRKISKDRQRRKQIRYRRCATKWPETTDSLGSKSLCETRNLCVCFWFLLTPKTKRYNPMQFPPLFALLSCLSLSGQPSASLISRHLSCFAPIVVSNTNNLSMPCSLLT